MVHRLEEYNNYILFQNKIADERIKGIEQGMLRISERIHELYGVGFPNSFILMLARWVYFGNVFDDALPEDSAEMPAAGGRPDRGCPAGCALQFCGGK